MSTQFTFYIADAFVDPEKPFSGNPAAVVILSKDSDISDDVKQNIAAQFNQCETVFVSKSDEDQIFLIRWFTPLREIELCGHATMAASYILFTENQYIDLIDRAKPIKYQTYYGLNLEASYDGQFVTLDFPSNDPVSIDPTRDKWITSLQKATLGLDSLETDAFLDAQLHPNLYLLLRLRDDLDIEQVKPNFDQMLSIDTGGRVSIVIVTQKANFELTGAHYTSRVFIPWVGVNEDFACGSACTLMAPYWERVFREESNGIQQNGVQGNGFFHVKQMSSRRGLLTNKLVNNRVIIGGQVRLFSKGQFSL